MSQNLNNSSLSLKTEVRTLGRIFCNDFCFYIPIYQRPYSWKVEQVEKMLYDLKTAMELNTSYFLGSVVVASKDGNQVEVIDGQQRLTTLYLMLLVYIKHAIDTNSPQTALDLSEHVVQKTFLHPPAYRLNIRPLDFAFFQKFFFELPSQNDQISLMQEYHKLSANINSLCTNSQTENDVQYNLKENVTVTRKFLGALQNPWDFLKFVLGKVEMIVISTENVESAFTIFSTLNARGLELSPIDKLKAELLSQTDPVIREQLGTEWDSLEEVIGRARFEQFFVHICSILQFFTTQKEVPLPKTSTFHFFTAQLKNVQPVELLKFILRYARQYENILSATPGKPINNTLCWLRQYEYEEWISCAVLILEHFNNETELQELIQLLDVLTFNLSILREHESSRRKRYNDIAIALIRAIQVPIQDLQQRTLAMNRVKTLLVLAAHQQQQVFDKLRKEELYNTGNNLLSVCRNVLLRLDEKKSGVSGVIYQHNIISVEHVLPQTPQTNSEWMKQWKTNQQKAYVHRLGNLALLTKVKNSQARNYDYADKISKYFLDTPSTFVLTNQLGLQYKSWTPDDFKKRHEELLKLFRLHFTPSAIEPTKYF